MKIITKQGLKDSFTILKAAFSGFSDDRCLKFSASLAYYTIFSLAPLLLLLISLAGAFFGREAAQGRIFGEINGLIGDKAAVQVQDMIKALELSGKTTISVIIGVVTLLIGATTIFGEIQDSINIIWKVKAKPKRGWVKLLKDRLLSSSLIVTIGFLLMVSLVVNGVVLALSERLKAFLPDITVTVLGIVNAAVSFLVIALLFGIIFKVLPDVKIRWKHVRAGAFFTACLFMIGRFVISLYIEKTASGSTYGAAGSLIVVLLWIYYTAAILYFGAEFTQAYTEYAGARIEPADYAVHVEQKETEKDVAELPPQHEEELAPVKKNGA
ncbi:YihY/virulence factor BrkB family protein [Hufsiella ginkgonis]|uniref:YihY family inner membrane protein n=1 Tax=Hufsiella ginkgonis TaxID=2695274 RepID=A0A7K1Y0Q1_9SPHI|nr:YihY/virulence factor BrkB family protein [Hufsiella ginkgonis]MXV16668.1 YihY family inner membrane protein [Hufsiella ginkgonis]